jgi:hypothetical protein
MPELLIRELRLIADPPLQQVIEKIVVVLPVANQTLTEEVPALALFGLVVVV